MALSPLEIFQFGGVDSRSNVLNFPQGRSLRCRNWVPKDSGTMELRNGFSTVTMSGSTSATAYNSLIPYTLFDNSGNETPYLILGQGTSLRVFNIVTGVASIPNVRGAALAGTAAFASYLSNGKIHFGNGVDQKWFDGTTVRDNGLRSLTAAEVANVVLSFGVGELSAANNSSITLTATGTTGTFPATSGNGFLFYVSLFDPAANEIGPATVNVSSGRVTTAANNKITVGGIPDFTVPLPTIVKLVSRTGDSLANAYFCTDTSTAITSCSRSGTTLTVISPSHGLSTGNVVSLTGTTNFDSVYSVTVIDANTFTVQLFLAVGQNTTGANTTGGTCKRIKSGATGATSIDILSPAQDTSILVNDANRGLAASATGIIPPGYQIFASIFNPNGGGHVGNRIQIGGGNFLSTTVRVNMRITGLPDLSGTDSEWTIMLGRTGDGAQIPYPCNDSNGNFFFTASGQTAITLTNQGALFGTGEMPSRSGVIPAALNMFARVNDRIHGGQIGRPTAYRSATEADSQSGDFVGRPEQAWAPNDIDTFPTAEGLRGIWAEDRGAFYGTKNDGAVFADLGQGFAWLGPWYGAGMAGTKSWCATPYGPFWLTGHKQLATMNNGSPVAVSDEYQTALLSRIGDAHLGETEMEHLTDIANGIDKIVIKCLDSSGAPFEVYHDFRNKDARSVYGQGYDAIYSAPLATNFIMSKVRDANGAERLWAGASSGQLYQLETGADDAGTQFLADAVYPINAGPNRPSLPEFRIYGDSNVIISITNRLDTALSSFQVLAQEVVPGEDGNSYYRYKQTTTKFNKGYLRMQLSSHSADGSLALNDPPHCPMETYGRVYLGQGLVGVQQGI